MRISQGLIPIAVVLGDCLRQSDSIEGSKRPSISHVDILAVALSISVVPNKDINTREEGERLELDGRHAGGRGRTLRIRDYAQIPQVGYHLESI